MIGGLNEINRLASKGKREDREPGPRRGAGAAAQPDCLPGRPPAAGSAVYKDRTGGPGGGGAR